MLFQGRLTEIEIWYIIFEVNLWRATVLTDINKRITQRIRVVSTFEIQSEDIASCLSFKEARDLEEDLVALSFSGAVYDMARHPEFVERIKKIVAGTAIRSDAELEEWILEQQQIQWHGIEEKAADIARDIWKKGMLIQTRLDPNEPCIPYIGNGYYVLFNDRRYIVCFAE